MFQALFQHIPRALFEPVAILSLTGVIFFLWQHWKKERAETVLWGMTVLFILGWRLVQPIRADRYVLFLIPVAIFFTIFMAEKIAKFFRILPVNFLLALLLCAFLVKDFHKRNGDEMFFEMICEMEQDARSNPAPLTVVSNRDLTAFLGKQWECRTVDTLDFSAFQKGDYCLFKLNREKFSADKIPAYWVSIREFSGKPDSKIVLWKKENRR